jgi:hypothetical protein
MFVIPFFAEKAFVSSFNATTVANYSIVKTAPFGKSLLSLDEFIFAYSRNG